MQASPSPVSASSQLGKLIRGWGVFAFHVVQILDVPSTFNVPELRSDRTDKRKRKREKNLKQKERHRKKEIFSQGK